MKARLLSLVPLVMLAVGIQLASAQPPQRGGGLPRDREGGPRMNPILRLFDTNSDGTLSAEEISGASAKLKELDASQDGQLTMDELRELMPFGGRGPQGDFPPGRPPGPGGPGRGPLARGGDQGMFDAAPIPKDDEERKILAALDEAQQGERFANVPPTDGRLLRLLTESVGAKRVVEIGTSTGESGIWFALALRKTGGHLFTHEIDEQRAQVAQENFRRAGVDELITLIVGDAHETVKQHTEPIDVLFLDADKEGYLDYLDKLVPLVRPGGLIIAHNMNVRQADANYVKAITSNPELETAFLYMEGSGVGVTMKKR